MGEVFTDQEKELLQPFVSNIEGDIFVLRNLPEVIKGALFSRYSRSSKGLRRLLLDDFILNSEGGFNDIVASSSSDQSLAIQKAQEFYDRILDGYGDDSIGELGGAHLAIENVSNMGTKIVQDLRIGGSPLEKSTRYILFDKKVNGGYMYYKDPKILQSDFADKYISLCNRLFDTYSSLVEPMKKFFIEQSPQGDETDRAYNFSIRARACDALRGFLPTCTKTNMGVFGNGRFFEGLITKLRVNDLSEMRVLGENVFRELKTVIPSFIRRSSPEHKHFPAFKDFLEGSRIALLRVAKEIVKYKEVSSNETVTLVDYDEDAEEKYFTALLYEDTKLPYLQLREVVRGLSAEQKDTLVKESLSRRTNRRHKPPRAAEHVFYTFDVLTDFGSYRDLHRHRMLTQQRQDLTCVHGYDVPPEISEAGFDDKYNEMMALAKESYLQVHAKFPKESQYLVPFAFKVRWYMKMNLRSVYWLTELRSGMQGHSTYRYVAQEISRKVSSVHPLLAKYMKFVDFNDYSLGRLEAEKKKDLN